MSADKSKIKLLITYSSPEIGNRVIKLGMEHGWETYNGVRAVERSWKVLIFNWPGYNTGTIIWGSDLNDLIRRGAGWEQLNADSDWDKLVTILRGEPEFDETPLPYDMTPELQSETMAKFNLSSEQWDLMPLMVREALAGCEVKQQELKVEAEWLPISEPPRGSPTILLTTNPNQPRSSVRDCALGYFLDGHLSIVYGEDGRRFTHWCHLPGPVVDHEEDEEEPDSEEA